ncbi:MAG TPA: MgtC/SapB family protein [Paludibacter sp.]
MTITEFSIRLLVAFAAGLLIGIEREWHHKSAGLRTNILVAIGSAIYVLLSIQMTEKNGDVTRIIGQVVTGIGFLGAGIIFKEGLNVHGLTTAATVWCASALGCTAAAGFYYETLIGSILVMSVNSLAIPLDKWLAKIKIRRDEENKK